MVLSDCLLLSLDPWPHREAASLMQVTLKSVHHLRWPEEEIAASQKMTVR